MTTFAQVFFYVLLCVMYIPCVCERPTLIVEVNCRHFEIMVNSIISSHFKLFHDWSWDIHYDEIDPHIT